MKTRVKAKRISERLIVNVRASPANNSAIAPKDWLNNAMAKLSIAAVENRPRQRRSTEVSQNQIAASAVAASATRVKPAKLFQQKERCRRLYRR